jgi:hypothetical protein
MEERDFPGNLEDAYRAGMTPRIRCGTIDNSTGAVLGKECVSFLF